MSTLLILWINVQFNRVHIQNEDKIRVEVDQSQEGDKGEVIKCQLFQSCTIYE